MKVYLLSFIISLLSYGAIASPYSADTEPEKIVSITQALYEMDYYQTQVDLWEKEVEKNESNANAWMNFYLACRVVNMLTPDQNPHDLGKIYEDIEAKITDTYEYHYLSYLNGRGDTSLFSHLEKAFALDPSRAEVLSHMVAYYAIKGDETKMSTYNKLWLESGEISTGILNWNYNALIGLDKNAILLTYGDNDTYPAWMLQQVQDIRTDVKVINIHLLRNREYIDKVFSECSLPLYPTSEGETLVWESDLVPVVDHIFFHTARPVYINVTLPKKIRENYKEVLYTVGLAFKYSVGAFDNIAVLKNNYENKFLKDYLKLGFSYDKSVTVLNSLNVNYLPAFISLYNHYLEGEDVYKARNIKEVIENIGKASGREQEIAAVLKKPLRMNRSIKSHLSIKQIDKRMKEVGAGLWADFGETSNEFYGQFLMDLLREKEFELLETCKSTKVDWKGFLPLKYQSLDDSYLFSNGHPDELNMPVVNISYEAAVTYCEWLTMVYNNYDKKKKFNKVHFRLPTKEEWEHAARAGRPNAPYPWGGYYCQNSKGCYLSNFYVSEEQDCEDCNQWAPGHDGGLFPVAVDAYFPNDYGLFNISGNVAEMVDGGKLVKGGSWEDVPEDCKISSEKAMTGPSAATGFRVFMEVIQQ